MVFHLLNNIYSWKKKKVWVQHTTLGRRGGEGGGPLAEKKSSTLGPGSVFRHPLALIGYLSCYLFYHLFDKKDKKESDK
jgi:hypothetical protein